MHMTYPIILCALLLVVLCNLFKERKRAVNVYQMCFKLDKTVSSFGYVAIGKMQWIPRYKHGQAMIVNILAITKLKTIVKNCVRYP